VVLFHGNPPDRHVLDPLAIALVERGILVMNVSTHHFASGGTIPEWYEDANCATAYAISHAEEYGSSPDHVILAGYSGGAGIALGVAANRSIVAGNCDFPTEVFPWPTTVVSIAGDHYSREFSSELRTGRLGSEGFWFEAFGGDAARLRRYVSMLDVEDMILRRTARPVDLILIGGMSPFDNIAPLTRWYGLLSSAGLSGLDVQVELVSRATHGSFITEGTHGFRRVVETLSHAAFEHG
jgi:acetyl esterase/lipase